MPSLDRDRTPGRWIAILVGTIILGLTAALWGLMHSQECRSLAINLQAESDYLASLIEADLRNRIPALHRVAMAWEAHGRPTRESFSESVAPYFADAPGFQAIEWVDSGGIARWAVPLEGNRRAFGYDLTRNASAREAMTRARDLGVPAITHPGELVQGGLGILIFIPIHVGQRHDGFILGVLHAERWLRYVFSAREHASHRDDFLVSVRFQSDLLYQDVLPARSPSAFSASSVARILDHELSVTVIPSDAFVAMHRSPLPLVVALFGFSLSWLVGLTIRLYQRSLTQSARVRAARDELTAEAVAREGTEAEIKRLSSRIDWAIKAARMGVWSWDLSTDQLTWNERMFELMGVPDDVEPTYDTWRERLHPDDEPWVVALLKSAVVGKGIFDTLFRIRLADGTVKHVRASARVERDAKGVPIAMTGLTWDVSAAKEAEEALRESEERTRLLLNSTGEAIYGIDLDGRCTFANHSCARMLGYQSTDAFLGKNMHELIHYAREDGTPIPLEECRIYRAFREGKPSHVDDEVLWRADGTPFPAEYWSYPQVADGNIRGAVVTFVDITERRATELRIRHMATHDGLTDLPALRLFRDRLSVAMSGADRVGTMVAVMFIDLDGFKEVNDTHGHDVGDETLKEVARRLKLSVREMDTVARAGGDEFLIVVTSVGGRDDAAAVAEKVVQRVAQPMVVGERYVSVGASVGVALYPADADSVDGLVKLADNAMYRAKRAGKNGYRFASDSGDPHVE